MVFRIRQRFRIDRRFPAKIGPHEGQPLIHLTSFLLSNLYLDVLRVMESHFTIQKESTPYFSCSRLNPTTFVIHECDKYEEHPFIYVKICDDPPLVILSDSGCGGGTNDQANSRNLRDFIETCPVSANGGSPLNPRNSHGELSRTYSIICTHCHYDHILGLNHFPAASSHIFASSYDKDFIQKNLAEHSLCKFIGLSVPDYKVSHWANDYEKIYSSPSLNLQILHTPGHTPDELAFYDQDERHLFVGDSFYERVAKDKLYEQAIIFPKEGNFIDYMQSLEKLLAFVDEKNAHADKSRVKVGCGHITSSVDGSEILLAVKQLFLNIIAGKVPIVKSEEKRGEEFVLWREDGEPRFSVAAPKRLVLDVRNALGFGV